MLERYSTAENLRRTRSDMANSAEHTLHIKAEFAHFQGKQPDQLPDTGERIDPKLLMKYRMRG